MTRLHQLIHAVLIALLLTLTTSVTAQTTRPDYQRADSLRGRTRNKVFRDNVKANWAEDGTQFWYRVDTAGNQHRYYRVDTETGERKPAFDHDKLAKSLSKASGKPAEGKALPIRNIEFVEGGSIQFVAHNTTWQCHPETYELQKLSEADDTSKGTISSTP